MARLFDAYIMVDWSAASKPTTGANSIWVGILARDARLKLQFQAVNPKTRLEARKLIDDLLTKLTGRGDRVLLGFDFSLGYPAGTAKALGLDTSKQPAWAAMHKHLAGKLKDKPDNSNARFAIAAGMNYAISKGPFPFWGAPARDVVSTLGSTRPDFDKGGLAEFREVERHLKTTGAGNPKSGWQLAYAGSVGSQSLTGIPHVHGIRNAFESARIWPFEFENGNLSEESLNEVSVVITEIYPSMIPVKPESGEILDAAQTRAIAHHYADLDAKNSLDGCFSTGKTLDDQKILQIQSEEGWILGA
ncbi:MAG: hypothetical protein ACRBEQ_04125 [Hyphomonas sp.]